jgi:DNA primase
LPYSNNPGGPNLFQEVKDKADIVRVISFYLGSQALVRKGKVYMSVCPFHHDTHPSMRIDPERKMFKCFACGEGGDCIKFVEKYAHLTPMEALKKVCDICQIPLPSQVKDFKPVVNPLIEKYQNELNALLDLKKFYSLALKSTDGAAGQKYLSDRKIPPDIIDHFGLGFAPLDDTLSIKSLREHREYSVSTLENAGILANSTVLRDHYSSRVMFPIEDNNGFTVAFSGRKIDKDQEGGKYINYLETPLFKKSQILYHYYKAKETARKDGFVYVVEGFMDVIAIVRAGINSVVGAMGTAITDEHIAALKNLNCEVRFCLDSDEPGQMGMERALPLFMKAGIPFRVVQKFLGGKDADEILTNQGSESLKTQLNRLFDPFVFLLQRAMMGDKKFTDDLRIRAFLKQASPFYFKLDEISQSRDLGYLSRYTGLDKDDLLKALKNNDSSLSLSDEKNEPVKKKTFDKEKYSNYRKKPYQKDEDNVVVQQVMLGSKYEVTQSALDLVSLMSSTPEGKALFSKAPKLFNTECQIILVLPQNREAYVQFESSRITLIFHPFYVLASLIGTIFMQDKNLTCFDSHAFDMLLKAIVPSSDSKEEKKSDDDGIDLGGIDDSDIDDSGIDDGGIEPVKVSPEEIETLKSLVKILSRLSKQWFSNAQFAVVLKDQRLGSDLYKLDDKYMLKGGGKISQDDFPSYLQERIRIQNKDK